jgi:hypothetical protein
LRDIANHPEGDTRKGIRETALQTTMLVTLEGVRRKVM